MSRPVTELIPTCVWCQKPYTRSFGTSWVLWLRCPHCKGIYIYREGEYLKGAVIQSGPGKHGWKILEDAVEGAEGADAEGGAEDEVTNGPDMP